MEIPGIPDSIPRAVVVEMVESLGIDIRELIAFRLEHGAIHAEVYALKDGNRYWDGGRDERAATHQIAIPIKDDAPQ